MDIHLLTDTGALGSSPLLLNGDLEIMGCVDGPLVKEIEQYAQSRQTSEANMQ